MTTKPAPNFAFPAALGGSIGSGLTTAGHLTPKIGELPALVVSALISAGMALVISAFAAHLQKRWSRSETRDAEA